MPKHAAELAPLPKTDSGTKPRRTPRFMLIGLDSISLELIERYCSPETTPHLINLMRSGLKGRALCSLPAYTPTNWAALATAAHPGSTGASGWHRTVDGRRLSTFDRRAVACDTIWDACARQGLRSLAVQYPTSYPILHADANDVLVPLDHGLVSCALRRGQLFEVAGPEAALTLISREDHRDAANRAALARRVGATEDGAEVREGTADASTEDLPEFRLHVLAAPDGSARICRSREDAEPLVSLEAGAWSPFVRLPVPTPRGEKEGIFRFKLLKHHPESGKLTIAVSQICSLERLASTPQLSRELFEEIGGFFEHSVFYPMLRSHIGTERFAELLRETEEELTHQIDWIVRASRWMQERRGWEVYYIHWHLPDSVIHAYLPLADPSSPAHTEEAAEHAHRVFEMTFRLCDRLVGGLLALVDSETTVLAVADHGNRVTHHSGNVMARLASQDLAVLDEQGAADPAKSPAVLRHADFRWQLDVNPAVVAPESRGDTVNRIIAALHSWLNEETGENVVSLALRRHHAALLGLWGPEIGDVVFFYADGYDWWGARRDPVLTPHSAAAHGPQLPTSHTPFSSDMPFFILRSPRVARGERWDEAAFGQVSLIDLVATSCHLAGIDPPLDNAGAVRCRLFKK